MKNKKYLIAGSAVVLMLLMFNFLLDNPPPQPINEAGVSLTPVATPTVSKTQTKTPAPNYTALVQQYEGKRIQFDNNCRAVPSYATYKNRTSIMFDNRSGAARVIKIGANSYSFQPFSYKILTLSSSKLPVELNINCGTSVNVARILLQN